jgi:helicase
MRRRARRADDGHKSGQGVRCADLMEIRELTAYGGSERLVKILSGTGMGKLYPPQAQAVQAGLLAGEESFVVAAPTASGKTLVAELAALKSYLEGGGKTLYLVPLRALAREKYDDLSRKYAPIGLRVAQSTGDYDSADPWLASADLIIATNEKLDSLQRHRAPWLGEVRVVVADEVHLLGDHHRGPTLEVVLTRLKWLNPDLRLIALSATIPNAGEIAAWLSARLVESDWRPVPLREGVYCNGAVLFNDGTVTWTERITPLSAVNLAIETIREGGQALAFVNTRKGAETLARSAVEELVRLLSKDELEGLAKLAAAVLGASSEPTRLCRKLAECVAAGVAFHHAGIASTQRRLIEDSFRAGRLRLITATTTLAMGLNLPSRRVVIRDWWRYESGAGLVPLPVMEVKQMGGRAGRPGLDPFGESVLIARDQREERRLFDEYVGGKVENVISRLAGEAALRTHILASIAGGFALNREELFSFLAATLYARQAGSLSLMRVTERIITFLASQEMVVADVDRLAATRFGRRVSELYIDPLTAVVLRDSLHRAAGEEPFPLLHMLAHTPDMPGLQLRKREMDAILPLFNRYRGTLLVPDGERYPTETLLAEIKTAALLLDWIEEVPEDGIVGHFAIGPGDLHNLVRLADWLLYAAGQVAKVFHLAEREQTLAALRIRALYGVKGELLELVSLRGIGRVRARNLFEAGYRTREELGRATVAELTLVPSVGEKVADEIKAQMTNSGNIHDKFSQGENGGQR